MTTAARILAGMSFLLIPLCACLAASAKPASPTEKPAPPRKKPLICAHRGASATAPENTMAAFHLARELGADSFELDTTLTSDGVPVLMHDATVDRTTDGTGAVTSLSLADVRRLDAGSWKDARYQGEKVPTLEEALTGRNGLYVNIELKTSPELAPKLAEKAVRLIEKHKAEKFVIISSFSAEALTAVHRLNPRVRTGYLFGATKPETMPEGISAVHPLHTAVTPEFMSWARSKGLQVNVWTVDSPEEMRSLMALGVDSIITNVPNVMREVRAGVTS